VAREKKRSGNEGKNLCPGFAVDRPRLRRIIAPIQLMGRRDQTTSANGGSVLGFEAKLWLAADKLRNNMDAAECKHVVLGLIFLKHISDPLRRELYPDLRADNALANLHQSHTLAALRDTLLPKLISGELRVKDAERFVGSVDGV